MEKNSVIEREIKKESIMKEIRKAYMQVKAEEGLTKEKPKDISIKKTPYGVKVIFHFNK